MVTGQDKMEDLKIFETHFRTRGIGVSLVKESPKTENYKEIKGTSFCQAVKLAHSEPLRVNKDSLSCPGARFVFGLKGAGPEPVIKELVKNRKISLNTAKKMFEAPARFTKPFQWILLNQRNADMYIFLFNPKKVMHFLTLYQMKGELFTAELGSIMAMCGEIAVKTLVTGKISLSFGCPDSRKNGGIQDSELIIGIPQNQIPLLVKAIKAGEN